MAGASITNDIILDPRLESFGRLDLKGIHVGGFIGLAGARLNTTDIALTLDNATIDGSVYLVDKFESAGTVSIIGSHISGSLQCEKAKLTTTGDAVCLHSSTIKGNILFDNDFEAAGTIWLRCAHIGGELSCSAAKLTISTIALLLDSARIDGNVFLRGVNAEGEIRLLGTYIEGKLSCQRARLTNTGDALTLDHATINGSVFLNEGFRSTGAVRLHGVQIGGQLNCQEAYIQSLKGENMEVKGDLLWISIKNREQTSLNLIGAKIKSLRDDHDSWPAKGNLLLDGLRVEDLWPIHARHLDTTGRVAWLNRQPDYDLAEPQPWLHLAAHLEAKGHKRAAKRVIYELRKHQSRANWKNSRFKHFGYAWDTRFARLEQQPFFILVPIFLLASLSGTTFRAYRAHFAKTNESAYKATHTPNPQAVSSYPKFQSFVYALENVLPVIKLGQDDKWAPDPAHTSTGLYRTLVCLRWFLILSGWVMGGILAAVSARFRS